ncbi:MAG TPA: AAA family ATPase, partial [Polyangiales bacterium]
ALLYELFCIDGCWFHTMELLSGVSFLAFVREHGRLHEERLRSALRQLLTGLAIIHAAGKVHRDLKPNNVLIEPDGRAVIVDYGLMVGLASAAATGTESAARWRAGTLAYMAPEQALHGTAHAAADMYAVGVMLFEALRGERPERSEQTNCFASSALGEPGSTADLEQLCAALLANEPRRRPNAHEALAALGAGAASPGAFHADSAASGHECFVGRATELRALHDAYARASSGRATLALVHGESGIGKSALLAQFSRDLRARLPAPLLWEGVCYERENTPYKMFDGVIASLVDQLCCLPESELLPCLPPDIDAAAWIFPVLRRLSTLSPSILTAGDRTDLGKRAFAAIRALFQRLRARAPVVICVDDLQWGDVDSMRLLQQLLAPPAPALLLVVAYRRSEEATSPLLHHALKRGGLHRLDCEVVDVPVDALGPTDSRALIMRQSAVPHAATWKASLTFERQLRAASGVPFLLRALGDGETTAAAGEEHEVSFESVVSRRVARCSSAARRLLDVLCLAGRPLQVNLALRVGELGSAGWSAASELCANRLARWRDTDGERCLEPYHDLIRSALAARAEPEQARALHASVVRHMQALELDEPTHLVDHLIAAGEREQAGQVAITAAQRAGQQLAWDSAARLLGLALTLLPVARAASYLLHAQHAEALAFAGRHRAAAEAYRTAAGLSPANLAAQHMRNAAQQLMRAGDIEPATALLEELLREVGLRYPRNEARAFGIFVAGQVRRSFAALPKPTPGWRRPPAEEERLATLATVYAELWLVDPVRSLAVHAWFFEAACRARDRYRLQALTWESASVAVVKGPRALPQVRELLAEIDLQVEHGSAYDRAVAQLARSVCLIHVECRPRDAEPLLIQAQAGLSGECRFERCFLSLMLDYVHEVQGDFASLAEAVLRYEHDCEDAYTLHRLLVSVPLVKLAQDQPTAALNFLKARWPRATRRATVSDFTVRIHLSSVQLYQGDAQAAFETLERDWMWLRTSGMFYSAPMRELADFYRARVAAARYRQTRDPSWRKRAGAREWPLFNYSAAEPRALTCMIEASLARTDQRHDACRALLLEAKQEHARMQNDTAYWAVQYRLAEVEAAPAALHEARAWMTSRGIRDPERWVTLFVP